VLRCVAIWCGACSVLRCVAVCGSLDISSYVPCSIVLQCDAVCCSVLQCVAMCCIVLQCVVVCCSVLLCVAVYTTVRPNIILLRYIVLYCVAVCCSLVQCFAACCNVCSSLDICLQV